MTSALAAIIVTISTNWHSIGTFTPHVGQPSEVQEGRILTNTIAIIEWKNDRIEVPVEIAKGPVVGERKVAIPNAVLWPTNVYYFTPNVITNSSLLR